MFRGTVLLLLDISNCLLTDALLLVWCRRQLAELIPGLRPWEVLSVEQAMDQITYGGKWYRQPLGTFTTGPPFIELWNKDVMV